jgi:hypothetical protein
MCVVIIDLLLGFSPSSLGSFYEDTTIMTSERSALHQQRYRGSSMFWRVCTL